VILQLASRDDVAEVFENLPHSPADTGKMGRTTSTQLGLAREDRGPPVWSTYGINGAGDRVAVSIPAWTSPTRYRGKDDHQQPGRSDVPGGWARVHGTQKFHLWARCPTHSDQHGTHTSGTMIGAQRALPTSGALPARTLITVSSIPGGSGSFTQVAAGMEWIVETG